MFRSHWFFMAALFVGANASLSVRADEPNTNVAQEFSFTGDISAVAYPDADSAHALRPQFHFTSRKNWLNDPNGMVHDGVQYHLFFQHNPKGTQWGNMTWGHATSPDMLRWTQHNHAFLPYQVDGNSGTIFSGTAVVDHHNSLGKQVGDTKTLVAFYTFATKPKFYQAMAYSTDRGATWTYWNDGRAVVDNQGFDPEERDPKVFWHEASQQWVMVLWVARDPGRVRFLTSTNLIDWKASSDLMRDWAFECMDVVFLPVDGDPSNIKCVVYDASFDYEIGTFDGRGFLSESGPLVAGGGNFYAAQTFNSSPDGRSVQIGWMRGGPNVAELYDLPFNQQMSFPCELTLRTTDKGVRLFVWPIKEIESLAAKIHRRAPQTFADGVNWLGDIGPLDLVDVRVDFDPSDAKKVVFEFPGVTATYHVAKNALTHTGVNEAGLPEEMTTLTDLEPRHGSVRLRFLIDRLSIETYAFDGEQFRAHYYSPKGGSGKQSILAIGGTVKVQELVVTELKSAW